MTNNLKEGDRIKMRTNAPEFHGQGLLGDGTYDTGTIVRVEDSHSSDPHYKVDWDRGANGYWYHDRHIEPLVPKEEIINSYAIY